MRLWHRRAPRVRWNAIVWPDGAVHLAWHFAGTWPLYLDRTRGEITVPDREAAKQVILAVSDALEGQQ